MSQLSIISQRASRLVQLFSRHSIRPLCTPSSDLNFNKNNHKVNNFEKRLLVWSGKYKSIEEVPGYVSQDALERARNKFRIRAANIMMVLTAIGCAIMIMSGRKAAERGESVLKMNQDWHKEYNEKAQAEALEKSHQKN